MIFRLKILYLLPFLIGYYLFYLEYLNLSSSSDLIKNTEIFHNITDESKITKNNLNIQKKEIYVEKKTAQNNLKKVEITISKGDTMFSILKKFNFKNKEIVNIIDEIQKLFDLRKLKINEKIVFYKDAKDEVKKIIINLDIDSILITEINKNIKVEKKILEKFSYQESKEFYIQESLYSDGLKNNLPQDILIKIIKLFSFDLDFQRDIRENTLVSVSYEINEIKENNKIEYKDINYALISINGKELEYFKFLTDDGFVDYFNREGKNVKKSILKTPLDGARLSSNFGMRKHPISGFNKMHKGVDFAAPKGTPIYAGGNGVVEYIGRNGGYGKYIRIRHNNDYKTAYAHLSGYKKGIYKGARVNQGEIIGYVGSTGNSTGPHLHYEILFQNKQINPLTLKLPSGKILVGEEFERFTRSLKNIYASHLNLLYE